MTELDVQAWGINVGLFWGVFVFLLGICSKLQNSKSKLITIFSRVYIGYKSTLSGSIIGAAWGFMDGAISGMLIAWIYNRIVN